MKTKITILFYMFFNVLIMAQNTYKISFDKNDFIFSLNDNLLTISSLEHKYFLLPDTLLAAIPYATFHILTAENSISDNFSVELKKEILYRNVFMSSNPKELPINLLIQKGFQTTDRKKAVKSSLTPVNFVGDNYLKGYSFASFNITPFMYDADMKELIFISEIKITINTNKNSLKTKKGKAREAKDKAEILQMVINPEEVSSLYPDIAEPLSIRNTTNIEYLIITTAELSEAFEPMIKWKIQKGVMTKLITIEEIFASYDGSSNQLKIKNCLHDYYLNNGVKWVLLGGDDSIIPKQGCYISVGQYQDFDAPTDLFYACFDNTFDWNANGNNLIGELDDNIDMYPEVYVSRLPVRSPKSVNSFVNKLLLYEKHPQSNNYLKKILLTGTKLWNIWNGQSDAQQRSEFMYNSYIAPYWNGKKSYFYDTGTSFPENDSYDLSSLNLQSQINHGYHFLHMATHGGQTAWGMEIGSGYNSNNASQQNNTNATIITTMACSTNAFDNSTAPCLSEAFIRNSEGACIAYLGSSRFGWGYASQSSSLGPSFKYNALFFQKLFTGEPFTEKYKFGSVVAFSKQQMVGSCSYYGADRWIQFQLNPIGDPEMPIWTDDPSLFSNISISQKGADVIVDTGGVPDCKITLSSSDDYGTSYFKVANNVSSYTFSNVTAPCYITVTKHNYIPYTTCGTPIYNLTNQTISSNTIIKNCNNINVKNVSVTNGAKLTLEAKGTTIIEGDFEVQSGSELEVK